MNTEGVDSASLYGATMQKQGVSMLVSVNLN
jgi:chromosome segregation ATPase